jgi:hypothetical protein
VPDLYKVRDFIGVIHPVILSLTNSVQ